MLQPFWGEPRSPGCGHTTPPRHSKPGWSSEPGAAGRGDATTLGPRAQGKAAPPRPPTGAAPCSTPGPPGSHSTWGCGTAASRCPPVPGAAVEAGLLHGIDGVAQELVRVLLAAEAEMPGDLCRETAISPRPPAAASTPSTTQAGLRRLQGQPHVVPGHPVGSVTHLGRAPAGTCPGLRLCSCVSQRRRAQLWEGGCGGGKHPYS